MKPYLLLFFIAFGLQAFAQTGTNYTVTVLNQQQQPLENIIVELIKADTKALVRTAITDKDGKATFILNITGDHYFTARSVEFNPVTSAIIKFPADNNMLNLQLLPADKAIAEVAIVGKRPFIQRVQGKTLVNVEASATNAGTTVLEVLEKSPGVMVDRNGGISLQGKASVLVLIDDKPTYLSGTELANLLGSMSSAQVNQIELITNPSAKYDASGNAGIINIKTKKNQQEGFNGNASSNLGHGRYLKNNNSLNLNLRKGKFNSFLNYSVNYNKGFTDIYAYRQYFSAPNVLEQILDQPTFLGSANTNQMLKIGTDLYASEKFTIGASIMGTLVSRKGAGDARATWLNPQNVVDSVITTYSKTDYSMQNGAANVNLRYKPNAKQEFSMDLDGLRYGITNDQNFTNERTGTGGYTHASLGDIPSKLRIMSFKADHAVQLGKNARLESGIKSSAIKTDNIADYTEFDGTVWSPDYSKSNHFLYQEQINSAYSSFDLKGEKASLQLGLRYENTFYKGNQLGNILKPDSAFSKRYSSLFPTGNLSLQLDSANNLSFTAGRRIDRPAYQKLNPFVFLINKYTHQQGNPYLLPQYSWNFEVSHSWKNKIMTAFAYSRTSDYFSQIFLDKGDNILVYTDGNVGKAQNLSFSLSAQFQIADWWSVTGQSVYNHKRLSGYRGMSQGEMFLPFRSFVNQLHTSINNQFRLNKTLNAELSGFYTTRARNDLQEVLYPTGQMSIGFSQSIWKGKGTLRLTGRDVFFTNAMEGLTDFPGGSNEYFILWRDSRVINFGLSYRFGKPLKPTKRSTGGATEEINRAG